MHCILDLETADWPSRCLEKGPEKLWPPLATLSWRLVHNEDKLKFGPMLSYVIKPENWTISSGISAKTYLTDEYAHRVGVDLRDVFRLLLQDLSHCNTLILFEAKKFEILKHNLKYSEFGYSFADDLDWGPLLPRLQSLQNIFSMANKQWLVPGTLRKPSLKQAWALLFDSEPQDPIASNVSVNLMCEMLKDKPQWPTELTIKLKHCLSM